MKRPTESDLERKLLGLYEEGAKLGYRANRFYQLFRRHCKRYIGGIKAVQNAIRNNNKRGTAGFEFARKEGRLDLSLEALVLDEHWTQLFTDQDRVLAKQNLDRKALLRRHPQR